MKSETLSPELLEERRKALATMLREDPANKEKAKAYTDFIKKHVIPEIIKEAQSYSFQEYFAMALSQATRALSEGNYAIGALYIYRANGVEYVLSGRNRTMLDRSTHPHAEENAIDLAESLDRGEKINRSNILLKRNAPHNNRESIVFCSLEPCIGCFRRLSTHKPNAVWIATPDEHAGAMLDGRREQLPGFWPTRIIKDGTQILTPSDDPSSPQYINPKYRDIALEMFGTTQTYIDKAIQGMSTNPETFLRTARRSRRSIFPFRIGRKL